MLLFWLYKRMPPGCITNGDLVTAVKDDVVVVVVVVAENVAVLAL